MRAAPGGPPRPSPYRTLQVDPEACPEVIEAAFAVLRERALRDPSDAAPRRLAELNAAHRLLGDPAARAEHDAAEAARLARPPRSRRRFDPASARD